MKFKKGDLIYYTREVPEPMYFGGRIRRGILTYLVIDAYKTRSGRNREYKIYALHDETGLVEKGRVVYITKVQEKHYRLEKW